MRLWERLKARGVEFTPPEYAARLRMHGRSGDATQLTTALSELLKLEPTPDAPSVAAIEAAVRDCGGTVRVGTLGDDGRLLFDADGCCGGPLRLLGLDAEERATVRDEVMRRAAQRSASGLSHLREFEEWLKTRPPFDYVLDGPNIAYFSQNYDEGYFRYSQIDLIVERLRAEEPGARILLLLPQKYLQQEIPNHTCAKARSSQLSDSDWALIYKWRAEGLLYECSQYLYDDWYWMFASVAETGEEVDGQSAPRVVTNDAMRDHWHELLPALSFARWRHSQVVAFGCTYGPRTQEDGGGVEELTAEEKERADAARAEAEVAAWLVSVADADEVGGGGGGGAEADVLAPTRRRVALQPSLVAAAAEAVDAAAEADAVARGLATGAWVASPPLLSEEAQQTEDGRWHVPLPRPPGEEGGEAAEAGRWMCFAVPEEEAAD